MGKYDSSTSRAKLALNTRVYYSKHKSIFATPIRQNSVQMLAEPWRIEGHQPTRLVQDDTTNQPTLARLTPRAPKSSSPSPTSSS